MLSDGSWNSLGRILDLVEELCGLGALDLPPKRILARRDALLRQLRLRTASGPLRTLPRPLSRLALRHDLGPRDLCMLFCLLHKRLATHDPILSGREMLQLCGASTATLLMSDAALRRNAPILRGGLVVCDGDGLDGQFRINEELFERLLHAAGGGASRSKQGPLRTDHDHFRALSEVVLLYERRAARLFPWSCWRDIHPEPGFDLADLTRRIKLARAALVRREARSMNMRLHWLRARTEHGIASGSDEDIILAALARHSVYTALPPFSLGDLVRLVATSPDDALKKRELLSSNGTLRSQLLVEVETDLDPNDPQAPAVLSARAREAFLPSTPAPPPDAQERRRFHEYMANLRDSSDFFRRLR